MPKIKFNDGLVLEVPEGQDPDEFAQAVLAARSKKRAELEQQYKSEITSPLEGMSPVAQAAAGYHKSVRQLVRGGLNAVGLVSDKTANDEADLEKGIDDAPFFSPAGLGNFVGNSALPMAVGAYLGGPLAALGGRGLGAGSVAATLGRPAVQAAINGAGTGFLTGSLNARPGERLYEGAKGAALGGVTAGILAGLTSKFANGPVATNQNYQDLERIAPGVVRDLPVSAKVDPSTGAGRFVKTLYQNVIPWMPGGGQVHVQDDTAMNKYMANLADESIDKLTPIIGRPTTEFSVNPQAFVEEVKDNISKIYDGVADINFDVSGKAGTFFQKNVLDTINRIKAIDPVAGAKAEDVLTKNVVRAANGAPVIKGSTIIELVKKLEEARNAVGGSSSAIGKHIDDVVKSVFQFGTDRVGKAGKFTPAWQKLIALRNSGGELPFYAFHEAVSKAPMGRASVDQVRSALMSRLATSTKAAGKGPNQELLDLGHLVFKDAAEKRTGAFSAKLGLGGDLLRWGGLGGSTAVGGMLGGPVGAAIGFVTPMGLARMASNPSVQEGLVGELASQKALAQYLARHPETYARIGAALGATEN